MYSEGTKFLSKKEALAQRQWYLIDAKGKVLGRLASKIATILQGKHKPVYTPNQNMGDFVVVINAKDIVLTGKKWDQKIYRWHSGYPGGLKEITARKLWEKHPERILYLAVRGMLPKNFQRERMLKKLKIFPNSNISHISQNLIKLNLD